MLWCHINLDYTATHCQTVAVMVSLDLIFVVTVYGGFFGESNSCQHEVSRAFISLHAKPYETYVLWTYAYER